MSTRLNGLQVGAEQRRNRLDAIRGSRRFGLLRAHLTGGDGTQ
jgi:hypothetical protein